MLKNAFGSVLWLSAFLFAETGFESTGFGTVGFEAVGFEAADSEHLEAAPQNGKRDGLVLKYYFDAEEEASLSYFRLFPIGKRLSLGVEAGVHFRHDTWNYDDEDDYWDDYDDENVEAWYVGGQIVPLVRFNVVKALFAEAGLVGIMDVKIAEGSASNIFVFGSAVGVGYRLFDRMELGVRYSFSFNEYDYAGNLSRMGLRAAFLF